MCFVVYVGGKDEIEVVGIGAANLIVNCCKFLMSMTTKREVLCIYRRLREAGGWNLAAYMR